jgi:membrane protein YqaA with SNARE-associated domain
MTGLVLGLVATGLVMSLVGSFAPVFAAEAYVVGVALTQPADVALAVAGAVVVGQTLGKAAVLASVRAAPRWSWMRGVRVAVARGAHGPAGGAGAWWVGLAARTTAWAGPVHRWTADALGRPAAPLVVVLSGAVGLPPLLAVTLCAGSSRMRSGAFVAACAAGRGLRMGALAVAPGLFASGALLL